MLSEVFCSYCLRPRSQTGPMVASPLAAICRGCAENAVELFATVAEVGRGDAGAAEGSADADVDGPVTPWARLSDDELLARLPQVAEAGRQVETHLATWVAAARERGISWARIGQALEMTRQSAWERFNERS